MPNDKEHKEKAAHPTDKMFEECMLSALIAPEVIEYLEKTAPQPSEPNEPAEGLLQSYPTQVQSNPLCDSVRRGG